MTIEVKVDLNGRVGFWPLELKVEDGKHFLVLTRDSKTGLEITHEIDGAQVEKHPFLPDSWSYKGVLYVSDLSRAG
jgi:hypothetical protein